MKDVRKEVNENVEKTPCHGRKVARKEINDHAQKASGSRESADGAVTDLKSVDEIDTDDMTTESEDEYTGKIFHCITFDGGNSFASVGHLMPPEQRKKLADARREQIKKERKGGRKQRTIIKGIEAIEEESVARYIRMFYVRYIFCA